MILVELAASKQRQRGRRLRAMTATKSQGGGTCVTGGTKLYYYYVVQESNTRRKLLFFQYRNEILFTRKNLSLFEQGTIGPFIRGKIRRVLH